MNIYDIFAEQLKEEKSITEEHFKTLKDKSFYGDYQVGDKLCYFMLQTYRGIKDGMPTFLLTIHSIAERELKLLENDPKYKYERTVSNTPVFVERKDDEGN